LQRLSWSGRLFGLPAEAQGYLSKIPSYNSIFDYLNMASLTPYLKKLIGYCQVNNEGCHRARLAAYYTDAQLRFCLSSSSLPRRDHQSLPLV
jgi:hypothetical protein